MPLRPARPAPRRRRLAAPRRGSALLLVVVLVAAVGAIALSAITLTQSTTLIARYHDRERDFRYAAEQGLALGRSRLVRDGTLALPDSGFVTLGADSIAVTDAGGAVVPRTWVRVYLGRSGNVTGQFGQFVTVTAVATDGRSTRYVRRLELMAENFARFAMFTNSWPASSGCYSDGEYIRGLGWSNQGWYSCNSPTYGDTIGAVGAISGGTPRWEKGPLSAKPNQAPIPLPSVARLSFMPGFAAGAALSFAAVAGSTLRLEFVAADVDGDGDSTGVDEGFVRAFRSTPGSATAAARAAAAGWGPGTATLPPTWTDSLCGDFHGSGRKKFYPVAVHKLAWFRDSVPDAGDWGKVDGKAPTNAEHDAVMDNATARCYPAGAPQLAAVERVVGQPRVAGQASPKWTAADLEKGGEDTTFTPNGRWGSWDRWPNAVAAALTASRRRNEAPWLFPLGKQLNGGYRGVVHVAGDALVGGLLRGRVTLYGGGSLRFVDDLQYVTLPNAPGTDCDAPNANMLGIIAVRDVMIPETALHRPQRILFGGAGNVRFLGGSGPHFQLHAVVMSLTGTVGVDGYGNGPSIAASACLGRSFSGGCIQQTGGVIQERMSTTTGGNGRGFAENREVDRCMLVNSPPYFPTTGRYLVNRYLESDPARFDPITLYERLQSEL